jgi:hypothetical protein
MPDKVIFNGQLVVCQPRLDEKSYVSGGILRYVVSVSIPDVTPLLSIFALADRR